MSPRRLVPLGVLLAASLGAAALGACDADFDPYTDGPPFFALDGVLDGRRDSVFVRVQDLRVPPGARPAPEGLRVVLTGGGAEVPLRDSLVALADGGTGLLYWAPLRLRPGTAYRLRAERADDAAAASDVAFATPPAAVDIEEQAPADGPVLWFAALPVPDRPIPPLRIAYTARRLDTGAEATVEIDYPTFFEGGARRARVNLSAAAERLRRALGLPDDDDGTAALVELRLRYLARAPAPLEPRDGVGAVDWSVDQILVRAVSARTLALLRLSDAQRG